MKQIDLTPQPLKMDLQRKKRLFVWVILAITALGVNTLWAGYKYWNVLESRHKQQQMAQRYNELQENIQSLIKAQSQLNRWRDRLVVLDKLGRYLDYVHLINFLTQKSPDLITLSDLEFRRDKQGYAKKTMESAALPKGSEMFLIKNAPSAQSPTTQQMDLDPIVMTLKGQSVDHKTVADYLKILNTSGLFLNTQLVNSKRQNRASKTTINFEIKCVVSPFPSLAPASKIGFNNEKTSTRNQKQRSAELMTLASL